NKSAQASNVRRKSESFSPQKALDGCSDTYWATDDGVKAASLEVDLGEEVEFDCSLIQEHIALGQRVYAYSIEAWNGKEWTQVAEGTTIGYKKINRFPPVIASKVRLNIKKSRECPVIESFELYKEAGWEGK
ncbi:MAG: discoidin domain-containing protein, partial [Candidatus Hinthialibacter sp.]